MSARFQLLSFLASVAILTPRAARSQQAIDSVYTAKIRELTPTDPKWKFTTELVDHLPASKTVPSPLKLLGYVPGMIGRLSKTADLNKYFRAVAAASPRVKVFSLGMSEEGREMLIAAVSDENTIKHLDDYRAMAGRLADPRGVSDAERQRLIRDAKPLYWLTGTIHAPETGSPEMLMELVYRLAVEETPYVKAIRDHVITLITPATETDGRDRIVDIIAEEKQLKLGNGGIPTVYWGHYIAHDNNRDGLMMSVKLTQNMNTGFLYWHPTIMHDLHESVPFLYTSTGTGPYNDEFDPIVIDEWHTLAYQEITELTKRGLPGVWTHGFYDGWAPNYMLGIAQFRNSLGKFYETYTSGGADCQIVNLAASATSREWDRPNPPVNGVKWCIRSNINYQQSGILIALKYVADNHETFMDNFSLKAVRMVDRGKTSAPYAFVIPRSQRHAAEAADLVNYFRKIGSEVHVATAAFTARDMPAVVERGQAGGAGRRGGGGATADASVGEGGRGRGGGARADSIARARPVTVASGDWVVRMDQPYTALVRTVLAVQRFRPDDPAPYDDTGWSLDKLRNVTVYTIADSAVLSKPMELLQSNALVPGAVAGAGTTLAVPHLGDWRSATLPWKVGGTVTVADTAFLVNGTTYAAGTFLVENTASARNAVAALGVKATALEGAPNVRSHVIRLPRIAFIHTWIETQNEGWVRHAMEEMGVPFTYFSDQRLREPGLLDRFDVVLFPHVGASATAIVNGRPMIGPPVPWKASSLTPSLGLIDSSDDIRVGMGLDGLAALQRFVQRGGLLITEGNSTHIPVDFAWNSSVSIPATPRLLARGAVFRSEIMDRTSPIVYGYDQRYTPVYFNTSPLFAVATGAAGRGGGGGADNAAADEQTRRVAQNVADPSLARDIAAQRARVIVRFDTNADSLLISGLLDNGTEMAGRAAVVDAPVGRGHVVLFGIRPMWRYETQGSYAMVLNAIANWDALGVNSHVVTAAAEER